MEMPMARCRPRPLKLCGPGGRAGHRGPRATESSEQSKWGLQQRCHLGLVCEDRAKQLVVRAPHDVVDRPG